MLTVLLLPCCSVRSIPNSAPRAVAPMLFSRSPPTTASRAVAPMMCLPCNAAPPATSRATASREAHPTASHTCDHRVVSSVQCSSSRAAPPLPPVQLPHCLLTSSSHCITCCGSQPRSRVHSFTLHSSPLFRAMGTVSEEGFIVHGVFILRHRDPTFSAIDGSGVILTENTWIGGVISK